LQRGELIAKPSYPWLRIGGHVFSFCSTAQWRQRYLAGQWIAAIGGAMLAGGECKHNGVVGQHGAHRQQPAAERLARISISGCTFS